MSDGPTASIKSPFLFGDELGSSQAGIILHESFLSLYATGRVIPLCNLLRGHVHAFPSRQPQISRKLWVEMFACNPDEVEVYIKYIHHTSKQENSKLHTTLAKIIKVSTWSWKLIKIIRTGLNFSVL